MNLLGEREGEASMTILDTSVAVDRARVIFLWQYYVRVIFLGFH